MKRSLIRFFLIISVLCSLKTSAQVTVSGIVMDSATREPLVGASVYCHNTSLGTATNKQGEFSLELKSGGYELIISFTGYRTENVRISGAESNKLEIQLVKAEKSMEEVIIRSTNEVADGWDKYGDFFIKNFIGATPNAAKTSLLNHDVLKFYYYKRSNKLKVLAAEPILIDNQALGYHLRYELDSFVYYYNTDITTYRGYCLFSDMEGPDSLRKKWTDNRKKTYLGSKLQFMRSYYDSTLTEDGFEISLLDEDNPNKFNKVKDPYDTIYYGVLDSTGEVEIWYPRKFSISYIKKRPETEYIKKFGLPKNVGTQISYIDMKDAIIIKENGYYYDPKDWLNQGYWSWKNLADFLPFDY
ncbi:MAG TPA: carboxypeptidase-like regulatory domain-containing protein [Chitinophagaceae bacterium]|nr:carboxypeptidase-like regulatory domain-containing protein [Chitinophagaceae bacterium]